MKDIIKELNVEKLNIVEADGSLKMSLFNSKNIPSLIMDNIDLLPGHREKDGISGLMFYNNHGDECGGLIYGSKVNEDGTVSMGMSLTFDKWKQDQVVQMHLQKENEMEQYGISIYDRPNKHIKQTLQTLDEFRTETNKEKQAELVQELNKDNQKRIFVGKDFDGETKIALFDKNGKEQIRLAIDVFDQLKIMIAGEEIDIDKLRLRLGK